MKGIILCLLGLIGTIVNGQQLENSSWTSIKITRKDGSAILPGLYGNLPFYAIRFDDGKAQITTGFNYFNSKVYQIDKANLTIENQVDYTIEFFDDTLLVYSAGKPDNSDLEKVNRYYLMNDRFYLDYLSENSLLPNLDDSIISATNYLYPRYKGEGLYSELLNFVTTKKITGALTGTLIINSEGEVYSFQARDIKSISVKDQEALEDFFLQTYGKWEIPYHLKK
ncbi:MAG: hypothetical protein U0T82_02105, partial [Bacteroidales bacterium]